MRSPALPSIVAVYAYAMLVVAVVLLALSMPGGAVRVVAAPDGVTIVARDVQLRTIPATERVTILSHAGASRMEAGELVADHSPSGSFREVRSWFDARSSLASVVAAPEARLIFADGQV